MRIPIERVGDLSFPDRLISNFLCDGSTLSFTSDGIFIERMGLFDAHFAVECSGYGPVVSQRFIEGKWTDADPRVGYLDFIGEWSIEQQNLRLAGFEQSGVWREYRVSLISVSITPSIALLNS